MAVERLLSDVSEDSEDETLAAFVHACEEADRVEFVLGFIRGYAEGRAVGVEQGRQDALEVALLALLKERFGGVSGLEQVAEHLAATGDFRAGLERLRAAVSLGDLRS